jgi:hypothetical protein
VGVGGVVVPSPLEHPASTPTAVTNTAAPRGNQRRTTPSG